MSNAVRSSGMPEGAKRRRRNPNELVWTQPRTISPSLHTNARSLSQQSSERSSAKNTHTRTQSVPMKQPQLSNVSNFSNMMSPCSQPNDVPDMGDWKMNNEFMDFCGPTDPNMFMSDDSLFSTPQSMDSHSFTMSSMSSMDPGFLDSDIASMMGCDPTMGPDPRLSVSGLSGFSAIHLAAHFGKLSIIQLLLSVCPEDVDLMNNEGQTPLHIAASEGHIELIPELLRNGSNALLQDADGRTALHLAVLKGHHDIVRLLLNDTQGQAMVRVPDNAGRTSLHQAVMQESGQLVRLMLERGADPRAPLA